MTLPEVLLWRSLRGHRGDERWRRQHPCGRYVLDFFQPAARLAVEVDGAVHGLGDRAARDAARDRWLAGEGIAVVRVAAADVLREAARVADALVRHATAIRAARDPSVTLRVPPPRSGED